MFKKAYNLINYFPELPQSDSPIDAMSYINANWVEQVLQTSDLGNRGDESSDFGILNITEASQVYSILQKEGY